MIEAIALFIIIAVVPVILIITIGIVELVYYVQNKRHLKWCNKIFATYPELKTLLSEYHRVRTEFYQTVEDAHQLQKDIDEWTEKNKYFPIEKRVDEHIEELKRLYCELLDIQAEQGKLVENAEKDLILFWERNFPDLPEHKRLMWWE